MATKRYELREAEIIKVVRAHRSCTMAVVSKELTAGKQWVYSTVKMLMSCIVTKGLLTAECCRSPRLTAVAESMRTLTSWIKPIFNHAIPRSTRIARFSLLVALVTVTALVPPARATSRPSELPVPVATSDAVTTLSQGLSGRVVDPNGRPLAGARVGIGGPLIPVVVHNGILEPLWFDEVHSRVVVTDAKGGFRFEGKWSDPFYVLVVHEAGFAFVLGDEFKKNREIRLEPWGRIEGQLARGRGGPDQRVWMMRLPQPLGLWQRWAFRYETSCGADGRFVFERVPAGWYEVGYLITIGDDYDGFTSRTPVAVKAGETAKVKVGGEGRPIVGRFVPPASYGKPLYLGAGLRALRGQERIEGDLKTWVYWAQQRQKGDFYSPDEYLIDPRAPDYYVKTVDGERWWDSRDRDWPRDDEPALSGANWSDVHWRSFAFSINPDGSFRIEDVIPGKYELAVDLEEKHAGDAFPKPFAFARYRVVIDVPSMAQAYTSQPLDLGSLTLDVHGVGEMAPLFEARALDGRWIRLIDYRGKFVLLSFQSFLTGDSQPNSDLNRYKELHKTYGDKGVLYIIQIHQADSWGDVRKHFDEHKIEWPVIWSDMARSEGIYGQYRVPDVPYVVLVDPEGRIVAVGLRGEKLTSTVREALLGVSSPAPAVGNATATPEPE